MNIYRKLNNYAGKAEENDVIIIENAVIMEFWMIFKTYI
jgi:hypothetical protein